MSRAGRAKRAARLVVLELIDRIVHRASCRDHTDGHWPCYEVDSAWLARIAHGDDHVDWLT